MSMLQLNPPIELETPKGKGLAWFMTDYGAEHNLLWTVAIHETGEIWTFQNPEVRATKNITFGRVIDHKCNKRNCVRCFDRENYTIEDEIEK